VFAGIQVAIFHLKTNGRLLGSAIEIKKKTREKSLHG
jgi:hypothetical protein